jgi:hypothetical protein
MKWVNEYKNIFQKQNIQIMVNIKKFIFVKNDYLVIRLTGTMFNIENKTKNEWPNKGPTIAYWDRI